MRGSRNILSHHHCLTEAYGESKLCAGSCKIIAHLLNFLFSVSHEGSVVCNSITRTRFTLVLALRRARLKKLPSHPAYVPSICTPFYLLTEVLPVMLVGLACETLHVIPGFTIVSDGGVVYILENTETDSTLVSKGREQSSRACKEPIRLFPSTKAEDLRCNLRNGTS